MPKIDITRPELIWPGKYDENGNRVENRGVALPFQVIETIKEGRATREPGRMGDLFSFSKPKEGCDWRNKLIWGDNLLVMASLLDEYAGKVDLIYIDPPFAVGADFSYRAEIGDGGIGLTKQASAIEEKAYRDTWGGGLSSYLTMLYDRFTIMRNLLSDTGSIYVHIGPNVSHYVKVLLDEIFGLDNYRSEIVWRRSNSHNKLTGQYGPIHDVIMYYTKSDSYKFTPGLRPFSKGYIEDRFKYKDHRGIYQPNYLTGPGTRKGDSGKPWRGFDPTNKGRHWAIPSATIAFLDKDVTGLTTQEILDLLESADLLHIPKKEGGQPMYKQYLTGGIPFQDIWSYMPNTGGVLYGSDECIDEDVKWLEQEDEKLGYETQKPEGLLKRILETSSAHGDLVADFFCGSGTTAAAAESLGRRWISCDLGRFAIHTTRKRLLEIPECKPFEILNLGKYERKYWQGVTFGEIPKEPDQVAIAAYVAFILELYKAQPLAGPHIHGKKGKVLVHVGAVDAPVTISQVNEALAECARLGQKELHILGWEWEMGMNDPIIKHAQAEHGITLRLLNIPREVMEKRAVECGDIRFFDLAYLEAEVKTTGKGKRGIQVELKNFVIPDTELIPDEVREKITKWSDYIDYWAVDWDFKNDTFMNHWQTYRTRKNRKLELVSEPYEYKAAGHYRILIKVVDIFGNDTSRLLEWEEK